MDTVVSRNSQVYYSGLYWNDFPQVIEYMCEDFTGDRQKWWVEDFQERFAPKPFEHGLFLNCGNGWVEREFIDKKIVQKATSFDYSLDLLRVAQKEKGERPIVYFRADVNKVVFFENQFDLVVNVAALHHVQYINRLCCVLCKALKEGGIFVNYDYIGPHRNQYSLRHWYYINRINRRLPEHLRKVPLTKPHLPTMLHIDPTEAIHSELIIGTVSRYFDMIERHDTGGGIAYEILTHNAKLQNAPTEDLDPHIAQLLSLDRKFTRENKVPPLFSYFIARPQKGILLDKDTLRRFREDEEEREYRASQRGSVYSSRDRLILLMHFIYLNWARSKTVNMLRNFLNKLSERM